ncbi:hypothetical protein SDC9_160925 [bioreactor metagenome]|uniref:Uncharacterized protein n=1 Tax=bioreactor metagenome TaxID=1076179 RepID=A0A645FN28_9ZZZZ
MQPVGIACQRNIEPVVDDEGNTPGCQASFQLHGQPVKLTGRTVLLTELHHGNTSAYRLPHNILQLSPTRQGTISNQVQAQIKVVHNLIFILISSSPRLKSTSRKFICRLPLPFDMEAAISPVIPMIYMPCVAASR